MENDKSVQLEELRTKLLEEFNKTLSGIFRRRHILWESEFGREVQEFQYLVQHVSPHLLGDVFVDEMNNNQNPTFYSNAIQSIIERMCDIDELFSSQTKSAIDREACHCYRRPTNFSYEPET